jgi:hypothetical protein
MGSGDPYRYLYRRHWQNPRPSAGVNEMVSPVPPERYAEGGFMVEAIP